MKALLLPKIIKNGMDCLKKLLEFSIMNFIKLSFSVEADRYVQGTEA